MIWVRYDQNFIGNYKKVRSNDPYRNNKDTLNILLPINQTFIELSWEKFNPRNAMYISRNDGNFNSTVSMQRDTLINANTLARIGRDSYTPDELEKFANLIKIGAGMN